MIEYTQKSIFDLDVDVLVNPVNCVGVCGKGLALEFRKMYPENYRAYWKHCDSGSMTLGMTFLHQEDGKWIANFPTKYHWRDKSILLYITRGLYVLRRDLYEMNTASVAIPALGCGLGGLDWEDVKREIEEVFKRSTKMKIYVIEPK